MEKSYGLIVEKVEYQEEVVIKPINEFLEAYTIFTGMTILSTGKVCFILDVQALAEKGGIKHTDIVSISGEKTKAKSTEPYFIFENYENEQFAIPIGQVSMIHQVPVKDLAACGENYFIDILDMEYKVINLSNFINARKCKLFKQESVYIIRLKGITGNWVVACKKLIGTKDFPIDINVLSSEDSLVAGCIIKEQTVINFLDLLELDRQLSGSQIQVSKSKALVVDDSRISRKLISQFLKGSGFEVIEAENGQDALRKIETNELNLILSDIEMPKMDGFELAHAIKEKENHIPVIALTSLNSQQVKEHAIESGFDDLILALSVANSTQIVMADGQGGFTAGAVIALEGAHTGAEDLNGDGYDDFVGVEVANFDGSDIHIALSNGDGTFGELSKEVNSQAFNITIDFQFADLNSDGYQDIVSYLGTPDQIVTHFGALSGKV